MARQVLPLVGAAVGFVASGFNPMGAQVGFAVGSMIGNAVDPIEMQGRKLGDAPTQVASEGGARAIVYGKGCIRATVVMERGGRRVIRQRDRSGGKGGGPTTINERALWTFAIGLGEPVAAILRIWENEKLVYDVTPASTIPDDTAEFAQRFRFYTGAEDQLPDPALEALHGADTPYYRGTAYMVFPQYDLTDFGETVPTYRVEVSTTAILGIPSSINDGPVYEPALPGERGAYLTADDDGVPYAFSATPTDDWITDVGDAYTVSEYDQDLTQIGASYINNPGSGIGDNRLWITGITHDGWAISADDNFGYCKLLSNGVVTRILLPEASTPSSWWYAESFWSPEYGGLVWFYGGSVYIGVRKTGTTGVDWNSIFRWPLVGGSGEDLVAVATLSGISASTSGPRFWMHLSRDGVIRTLNDSFQMKAYNESLVFLQAETVPPEISALPIWDFRGFGVDEIQNLAAFVYNIEGGYRVTIYRDNTRLFLASYDIVTAEVADKNTRIVFSEGRIFIQLQWMLFYVEVTNSDAGLTLGDIVASVHERADATAYDVSELPDPVAGVVFEQTSTAAEAINSMLGAHFADPSDYDGLIHYIKRGKPVVLTLTEDDLLDEPDEAQRNNAIEYPKKVHFLGQRSDLAYASSKSTSSRYSGDARVVGEITIGSPETYDDGTAPAEVAVKLHKVLWTEAEGERGWLIPDNYLGLVPTDNVGLSYRGELVRCRILSVEDTPGQRKLRMIRDRQSAYTANLTEIPNPPAPTPPQSSVVAPTVMAFIDSSALTDNADTLHYLVALTGANDNWAGAVLQQQLVGSFQSIDSTTLNSIMGVLQSTVSDAAPWYTDTTNAVVVRLYTDDQLESRTDAEFLSNGGAFFLSWESSGQTRWEIMQFRDAVQDSNGDWVLSRLMRGRKNTETAEHPPGATFVWIDPSILREPAQTSWINTTLTHRAVSNGQSPDLAAPQDNEYVGNSQREWPVADLLLSRPTGATVQAEAIPRHRFGTSMNPVRSINWDGYRWTATDGVNTINRDGTSDTESFDTTGWGTPVTVTVAQLNRLTGAGPTVSEEIV